MWRCGARFQPASEQQAGSLHHNGGYSNLKITLHRITNSGRLPKIQP